MAEEVKLTQLKPYTMIEGPMWTGPVTFRMMGHDSTSIFIEKDGVLKEIHIEETGHGIKLAKQKQGEPWKAFLAVERLRHKHAMNIDTEGSADQLPHQLKTIYQVSGESGRIRYMIADEPGGGKTIVASRIIQELLIQKQVRRVLVVVPALLKYQWKEELKKFVNIDSRVIESGTQGYTNPWLSNDVPVLITSMDYAKTERQKQLLEQVEFDLVVIDEAHNLNATTKKATERYHLAELLGRITRHMIFLTATPHRGKPDNFRLLLKLLEPDLFSNKKMTAEDVFNTKDRLFIRHSKDEMVDMDNNKLFRDRSVRTIKYNMSSIEQRLYETVTDYVSRQYNLQMGRDANQIATFAVLIIQKRMASSTHALLESLKNRRKKLGDKLEKWDGPMKNHSIDDIDDMDEDDLDDVEEKAAGYTSALSYDELEAELNELDGLIELAKEATRKKPDTKLKKLIEEIRGIGDDKLLIFSEYKDTLDYLERKISEIRHNDGTPYEICRIDGTMKMREREDAQKKFRGTAQIMLATDAAREGINLQFCHRMINYDLPWTPISLEQRMGRLHRYGQEHDVVISNLVADGTREGHVMETLFEKIHEIEQQYPTFNVMGQVLAGGDLKGLMTDAIQSGPTQDIGDKVDKAAERAKEVDEMLGRTPIDVEDVKNRMNMIKEQRTDGKYLINMVEELFRSLGGSIRQVGEHTKMDVPEAIRYGPFTKRYMRFKSTPITLLARSGKIYDHIEEWIAKHCSGDLKNGSVFRDPGGFDGYIIFHTIPICDKSMRKVASLFTAHKYADGVTVVAPYVLHGLKYESEDVGTAPHDIQKAVREMGRAETDKMIMERKKIWDHRTKAAKERMQNEIKEIQKEMSSTGFGSEWNELAARRDNLKRRIKEVEDERENAVTLTPYEPTMEGWVRVIPDGKHNGSNTEKIGIDTSMKHERDEGFVVQDVQGEYGRGYDLISENKDGWRREIEVKALCNSAAVHFTPAEKLHLKNENAVVHVISNAGQSDQRLDIIYNTKDIVTKEETVHVMSRSEIHKLSSTG